MIQVFRLRTAANSRLIAGLIAAAAVSVVGQGDLRGADKAPLTYARLKELSAYAIKTGAVTPIPGKAIPEGNMLKVKDVMIKEEMEFDQNPYIRVYFEQIENDLRRQHLLQRQTSRQTMQPYFGKMDAVVAKMLAVVEDSKLSREDKDTKLNELSVQLQDVYKQGMDAVAKSMGLAEAQFLAGAGLDSHPVQLMATKGATIDMVRQTTAWVLKDAGTSEKDYPWASYQAGETVQLIGSYYCRVSLNGKQATTSKKVGEQTMRLEFPDP